MKKISSRLLLLWLTVICLAQAPPPAPPAKTILAVYPIKPAGVSADLTTAMTALLTARLTPSPRLKVVEEAMLKTVMERQAMNVSDACDDTSCQVEIGKLVKAQKMVTGTLSKLGANYYLSTNLVDIQTGATEFTTEDKCSCSEEQLENLIAAAVAEIRNHFGENLPIPNLPVGQALLPVASSPQGASPTPQGAQAFLPAQKTFQEFHPQGAKGGPMVLVSDFKFYIDKFEVTNQDFQECVTAGACQKTKQKSGFDGPQQPVVYVDQNDARTYCQWAGKRLPKEQEWQEAAQGTDGRQYPWGNQEPNCSLANYAGCGSGTDLVGSKTAGASPYGAMDMAGNVYEWVEEKGVLRGGGWLYDATYLRMSYRDQKLAAFRGSSYGFRCARD